jgi:hypothetical protein
VVTVVVVEVLDVVVEDEFEDVAVVVVSVVAFVRVVVFVEVVVFTVVISWIDTTMSCQPESQSVCHI